MGAGSDHLAGYSQIEGVMSSALPKRNGPIEEEPVPRPATTQDLASFVAIQLAAFPGSLTTQLGARFLAAYYSGIVDAESAIALIAEHDGEAVGIAVGFINPSVFYESLRHRKRRLALAMIPGLARRPWLVGAVVRNYFWAGTSSHGGRDIAELASIAVLPQASGVRWGGRLLEAFVAVAEEAGATRIVLTTDASENDRVRGFYENFGFQNAGSSAGRTRPMIQYSLDLRKDRPS